MRMVTRSSVLFLMYAVACSSGMAAITTIFLTFLKKGDHLIAGDCLYGGTHDFLTQRAPDLGIACTFVDDKRPETWEKALRPETRMFLVETITNPLMRVPRLADVVEFARRKRIMTVIDNTFASPVNFRPLSVGFDLLFHSATKYLNGHSDLVAGCVMGSAEKVERVARSNFDLASAAEQEMSGRRAIIEEQFNRYRTALDTLRTRNAGLLPGFNGATGSFIEDAGSGDVEVEDAKASELADAFASRVQKARS